MAATDEAALTAKYVVQVQETFEIPVDHGEPFREVLAWVDLTTVEVPSRTKRKTVLQQGLTKAGLMLEQDADPAKIRVLDEENAHEWTARPAPPEPPRLEIG